MRTSLLEAIGARSDEWRGDAACRDADPWLFYNEHGRYPPAHTLLYCHSCPVRTECLSEALRRKDPWGVWGGTTGWQRAQILRGKSRRTCQFCKSDNIRRRPGVEICMACGISWRGPGGVAST